MSNHPRRTKPLIEGTPTPEEIMKAREAAHMTPQQAADLIWHAAVQWLQWESGDRRMHPCTWWAFQQRIKGE